jgi:hypothetical protein
MAISAVGAVILTVLNALWINVQAWQLFALLFAGMFTITANVDYIIRVLKGNTAKRLLTSRLNPDLILPEVSPWIVSARFFFCSQT